MMRVVARGKSGIVILRDKRPDGSYVLLQCEEFTPTGNGGVLGLPDAEKDEEFPMLLTYAHRRTTIHAERTGTMPFSLEVDISAMSWKAKSAWPQAAVGQHVSLVATRKSLQNGQFAVTIRLGVARSP
jgi:hypothetical protein